uniref:Uncharacterized protein n=1 Tax=Rhizophagus irregularis (strain DAOM 181602 / DAOM 197198 / MUCL 43194) TaxID=747089 RepID=U9SMN8_RHIID
MKAWELIRDLFNNQFNKIGCDIEKELGINKKELRSKGEMSNIDEKEDKY